MPTDMERELQGLGVRLLADAPPITTAEVIEHRRVEVPVMNGAPVEVPVLREISAPRSAGRWRGAAAIGVAAAAGAVAVGAGIVVQRDAGPVGSAESTVPTAPAQVPSGSALIQWPPRLLLDGGWQLSDANERSLDEGSMQYTQGDLTAIVGWYRDTTVASGAWMSELRQNGYEEVGTALMLGEPVPVLRATLHGEALEAPAPTQSEGPATSVVDGQSVPLELNAPLVRGDMAIIVSVFGAAGSPPLDPDEFSGIVSGLQIVEHAEWEAALPGEVVTVDERSAVVDEMLAGVPISELSRIDDVRNLPLVQNRVRLAELLIGDVECGWLNTYFIGDQADQQEARDALASVQEWPLTADVEDETFTSITVQPDGSIAYRGQTVSDEIVPIVCGASSDLG